MKTIALFSTMLLLCTGLASSGTISDAVAAMPGSEVTINDALILSTTDLAADPGYRSFQLRDTTRAITVYGTNTEIQAALTSWAAGDGINITGVIAIADGAFRLEPLVPLVGGSVAGFAVTGRTSTAPFPFPTSAFTVLPSDISQPYESELVRLQNVSFTGTGIFDVGFDYALSGGSAMVRIATADLNLVGQPIPTGPVNITGIVLPDPDGDGYVLAPRANGDIVLVPEPASLLLLGLGGFLIRKR